MGDDAADLAALLSRLALPVNRAALLEPVLTAAPEGMDAQTYPVLDTLASVGPLPAARLAEHLGIDRSGCSRYADRLQAAGLIRRTVDPLDRRATLLSLTPKGVRLIDKLNAVLAEHLASLTAEWPAGAARALADGLGLLLDGPPAEIRGLASVPRPPRGDGRGTRRRPATGR